MCLREGLEEEGKIVMGFYLRLVLNCAFVHFDIIQKDEYKMEDFSVLML